MKLKTKAQRKAVWKQYAFALDRLAAAHLALRKSKRATNKTHVCRAQEELKAMEVFARQIMAHRHPGWTPDEIEALIRENRNECVHGYVKSTLEKQAEERRVQYRESKLDPRVRAQRAEKARRAGWVAKWHTHRTQGHTKARRLVCSMAISA